MISQAYVIKVRNLDKNIPGGLQVSRTSCPSTRTQITSTQSGQVQAPGAPNTGRLSWVQSPDPIHGNSRKGAAQMYYNCWSLGTILSDRSWAWGSTLHSRSVFAWPEPWYGWCLPRLESAALSHCVQIGAGHRCPRAHGCSICIFIFAL
jgi:hypothetical protein